MRVAVIVVAVGLLTAGCASSSPNPRLNPDPKPRQGASTDAFGEVLQAVGALVGLGAMAASAAGADVAVTSRERHDDRTPYEPKERWERVPSSGELLLLGP